MTLRSRHFYRKVKCGGDNMLKQSLQSKSVTNNAVNIALCKPSGSHSHLPECLCQSCLCCWAPLACWRWQHCCRGPCRFLCTPVLSPPPLYNTPPQSVEQTAQPGKTIWHTDFVQHISTELAGWLTRKQPATHAIQILNDTFYLHLIQQEIKTHPVNLCRWTVIKSHSKRDPSWSLFFKGFPHDPCNADFPSSSVPRWTRLFWKSTCT